MFYDKMTHKSTKKMAFGKKKDVFVPINEKSKAKALLLCSGIEN